MKSAGNEGGVQRRLQVLHIHVFLAAPLGTRHVAKSGADQHQGGVAIGECPHHAGAAADLTVQPLDHVVGTDAGPMLAGKIAVGQRFLCTIFSDIVCCLLSEWCVVTSFYQSSANHVSFYLFSNLRNLLYLIISSIFSFKYLRQAIRAANALWKRKAQTTSGLFGCISLGCTILVATM